MSREFPRHRRGARRYRVGAHRASRTGFTLVELLVAASLLALVAGGAVTMLLGTARGMQRQREVTNTEDGLRAFEQTLTMVLRTAAANPEQITGSKIPRLIPNPLNATSWNNVRVLSDFNPADGDTDDPLEDVQVSLANDTVFARWQAGTVSAAVVAPVSTLRFDFATATGTPVTTAAAIATARLVRVTLEAPRRAGSSVRIRRQWTIHLRNLR